MRRPFGRELADDDALDAPEAALLLDVDAGLEMGEQIDILIRGIGRSGLQAVVERMLRAREGGDEVLEQRHLLPAASEPYEWNHEF